MPSEILPEPKEAVAAPVPVPVDQARGNRLISPLRYLLIIALFLGTMPLMRMADGSRALSGFPIKIALKDLPLEVGPEKAVEDGTLDDLSLSELEPDEYLWRRYAKAFEYQGKTYQIPLDFMVIYGHQKKTFHSPGFCLPGGGWQIAAKTDASVRSERLPMPMNLFYIQREFEGREARQIVIYSFMQGDRATANLVAHNINLLRARILHQRPTGALVRVVVPVVTTEDEAIERATDFITAVYPKLRQRIG